MPLPTRSAGAASGEQVAQIVIPGFLLAEFKQCRRLEAEPAGDDHIRELFRITRFDILIDIE